MDNHPPSSILHPRRILVRGTNWLGDAVMATPALLRLRERFPGARITILTPEKLANLWESHPAIDDIFSIGQEDGMWSVAHRLRLESSKQVIDLALVLPNSPRSALEVFFARIRQRVGYARSWREIFLTQAVAPRAEAVKMRKRTAHEIKAAINRPPHYASRITHHASDHQIHDYLHLVAALGADPEPLAPQLFVSPVEDSAARAKFGLDSLSGPVFGLNPGAEYGPAKRWPAERFIAVAREIQKRTNCVWLLFGGKSDEAITAQIQLAIGNRQSAINLAGQTTLRELMALLKLCRVLLTNDTGPMHMAAALGTPVVVPFGSTSPELTGPGLPGDPRHRLLKSTAPCAPCFRRECPIDFRCMNGIAVEQVAAAILETVRS